MPFLRAIVSTSGDDRTQNRGVVHGLTVEVDGATLAGSLWLPAGDPVATVVMHPGSGPGDRHNDGYFVPIREHLLAGHGHRPDGPAHAEAISRFLDRTAR